MKEKTHKNLRIEIPAPNKSSVGKVNRSNMSLSRLLESFQGQVDKDCNSDFANARATFLLVALHHMAAKSLKSCYHILTLSFLSVKRC